MRALFQCKKYEVLSMDGLRYETKLDRLYNADKQTHIPIFERDKDLFVQVGNEVRKFDPKLIRYGFRYYDNEGNLSQPFTAVICELEGETSDCVILGKYAQSANDDYWDSLSPFSDVPSGRWNFWQDVPEIFFYDRERTRRKPYGLYKVNIPCGGFWPENGDRVVYAFRYNPEKEEIEAFPTEIQELSFKPNGEMIVKAKEIDEGNAFWTREDCRAWCKENFIVI